MKLIKNADLREQTIHEKRTNLKKTELTILGHRHSNESTLTMPQ